MLFVIFGDISDLVTLFAAQGSRMRWRVCLLWWDNLDFLDFHRPDFDFPGFDINVFLMMNLQSCTYLTYWIFTSDFEFLTFLTCNISRSSKLRGELDNEVKQQALFKLLGQDYVTMYFRNAR